LEGKGGNRKLLGGERTVLGLQGAKVRGGYLIIRRMRSGELNQKRGTKGWNEKFFKRERFNLQTTTLPMGLLEPGDTFKDWRTRTKQKKYKKKKEKVHKKIKPQKEQEPLIQTETKRLRRTVFFFGPNKIKHGRQREKA